jgi:hypothetical protein
MNQRGATKSGGVYGTIIGDWRRNGIYTSYQAKCISRMAKRQLLAVLIKTPHNTMSRQMSYGRMSLPFILHEYVLFLLGSLAKEQASRLLGT